MTDLTNLTRTSSHDWYLFYDSLDSIIEDVFHSQETSRPDAIVLVQFLNQAQSYLPGLNRVTKRQLLVLLRRLLNPLVLRPDNTTHVLQTLHVILRTRFPPAEHNRIFAFLLAYTNQAHKQFLTESQRDQLMWRLTVLFTAYSPDFTPAVEKWLRNLHQLVLTYYLEREAFWLKHYLHTWTRIRSCYAGKHEEIDDFVLDYIHKILLISPSKGVIKETVYIEYTQFLKAGHLTRFEDVYTVVSKNQVLPYHTAISISPHAIRLTVRSQQKLSVVWKQSILDTATDTYHQMEHFKWEMNLSKPLTNGTFIISLFDNQTEYTHYLALWNLRSDNGGFALVVDGQYLNYVYRDEDSVRNLGHELSHSFFFAWMGPNIQDQLPVWVLEGLAETMGNQTCDGFFFIKKELTTWTPSIPWITHLDYSNIPDVYHWGSVLFRYLRKEHPRTLRRLLIAARQQSSSKRTFNHVVDQVDSRSFSDFLMKDQQACSEAHVRNQVTSHPNSNLSTFIPFEEEPPTAFVPPPDQLNQSARDPSPTQDAIIRITPINEITESFPVTEIEPKSEQFTESSLTSTLPLHSTPFESKTRATQHTLLDSSSEMTLSGQEVVDSHPWELESAGINRTSWQVGNITLSTLDYTPPYDHSTAAPSVGALMLVLCPLILIFLCVYAWGFRRKFSIRRRSTNRRVSPCLLQSYVATSTD